MSINEANEVIAAIAEITEILGNDGSEGSEENEDSMENAEIVLDTASGFDVILNNKIKEINELYELKTKNKKMTSNVNEINFMDKKLYNKINAAIDKKYKESKQYKKKCEEEVQNAL
jgi:hypothetical protein